MDPGETDPRNPDTDGDGVPDGEELERGTSPLAIDGYGVTGGGGCSSSGGSATSWAGLLLVLGLWIGTRRRAGTAMVALLAVTAPLAAQAQSFSRSIDVQHFKAAPGESSILGVQGTEVLAPLAWSGGLFVTFATDPLVLVDAFTGERRATLISNQTSLQLVVAMGLFERVELGLSAPLTFQSSPSTGVPHPELSGRLSAIGMGDLRLVPRVLLLPPTSGFQLAAALPVVFPTGGGSDFRGGAGWSFQPRLIASYGSADAARVIANVGVNLREKQAFLNVVVGNELAWALAGRLPFAIGDDSLAAVVNVIGVMGLGTSSAEGHPVEALAGLEYEVTPGWALTFAGGRGAVRGYGSPDLRIVGGLVFTPPLP